MKKILLSLLAVGAIFTANAQMAEGAQARVYAYDLKINSETKVVTFKTNTVATTAKVIIDGITEEVVATSNDGKSWTATIEPSAAYTAGTEYNWSVEVSAPAVNAWNELAGTPTYSDKKSAFRFYRSFGLCVNQNPESDYFGNVYAAHQFVKAASVSSYRSTGMYVYNPDLTLQNNGNPYQNDFWGKGESTTALTSGLSPADMCISEDGRIFMTNITSTDYNIYVINPNDLTQISKVFTNATIGTDEWGKTALKNTDDTRLTGLRGAITATGSGEDTEVIVLDSDIYAKVWYSPFNVFKIGESNVWVEATPSSVLGKSGARMVYTYNEKTSAGVDTTYNKNIYIHNGLASLESTKNGFWAVQTNNTQINGSGTTITAINDKNHPTLFYYSNKTGKIECINNTLTSNYSPALAANSDLGLVAFTTAGTSTNGTPAVITKYTEDENCKVTIQNGPNATDYLMKLLGSKADAMSFDYAGNLYAVTSGNETMVVYALPDALVGPNTRVTPAKKSSTISFTQDEIDIATGLDNIAVDANAPVEYYNMQGVKVENPSNGIFIKKQGNKTTKVVL